MRFYYALISALALTACTATTVAVSRIDTTPAAPLNTHCSARQAAPSIDWRISDAADEVELARWCRGVGAPVMVGAAQSTTTPQLDDLVVLSWNGSAST